MGEDVAPFLLHARILVDSAVIRITPALICGKLRYISIVRYWAFAERRVWNDSERAERVGSDYAPAHPSAAASIAVAAPARA
jgi:hypothetical protein